MEKIRAIDLLKQALTEIPKLKVMHYDSQEFKLWLHKVETIIKNGLDDDYNTFSSVQDKYFLDDIGMGSLEQEIDYLERLQDCETALKSIIQKYELLGVEEKLTPIGKSEEVSGDGEGRVKMDEIERRQLLKELNDLHKGLTSFERRKEKRKTMTYKESQIRSLDALRRKLKQKYRWNKEAISKYGGDTSIKVLGQKWDVFNYSLSLNMAPDRFTALDTAIKIIESTIKENKSLSIPVLNWRDIKVTKQPKEQAKKTVPLFVPMQLHPRIIEVSESLFKDGYYPQAIFEAFKALNIFIKKKAGSPKDKGTGKALDGRNLMSFVFNEKNPIIALNDLKEDEDIDEQEGFRFLFMGATVGIRNPKAHAISNLKDPYIALEYLSLASLLMKRAEEGKLVKTRPPRKQWNLQRFLMDTKERCGEEILGTISELHDFTKNNAFVLNWGTGAIYGSFTFRQIKHGRMASIFTVYSNGTVYLSFGSMKNKGVSEDIMESFRKNLNKIPEIGISQDVVTIDNKYPFIWGKILTKQENIRRFEDAVLFLCQQIKNGKE